MSSRHFRGIGIAELIFVPILLVPYDKNINTMLHNIKRNNTVYFVRHTILLGFDYHLAVTFTYVLASLTLCHLKNQETPISKSTTETFHQYSVY